MVVVAAGPEVLAGLTARKMTIGAMLGGGFDTAGQLFRGQPYRGGALTGAVAYPFSGVSLWRDAAIGAGVGGGNTVAVNGMYGEGIHVGWAILAGGTLSGVGSYIGGHLSAELKKALPQRIGAELIDPKIPALFQNIGKPNPYPNVIGNGVGNIIGGSSVFIPLTSTEPESDM